MQIIKKKGSSIHSNENNILHLVTLKNIFCFRQNISKFGQESAFDDCFDYNLCIIYVYRENKI